MIIKFGRLYAIPSKVAISHGPHLAIFKRVEKGWFGVPETRNDFLLPHKKFTKLIYKNIGKETK